VGSLDFDPTGLTAVALEGSARQLIVDGQESLWWRAGWGLGRFDPASSDEPTFFLASDDLFFGSVTAISPSVEAGIWVAGRDSTLRRLLGNRFVEAMETPEAFCQVAESPTLGLWAAGCGWTEDESDGTLHSSELQEAARWLYRWDGDEWVADPEGRPYGGAAELTVDLEGQVWVANREVGSFANTGGLSVFDGDRWTTFTTEDGLPSTVVQRIAGTLEGEVWVSTFHGPAVFDGARWRSPSGDADTDRRVWRGLASIVELGEQRVALSVTPPWSFGGALSKGFIRLEDGELVETAAKRGEASDLVISGGRVWIAIDDELLRLSGAEFEPVVATMPSTQPMISAYVSQIAALSGEEALVLTNEGPWWCSASSGCGPRSDSPPLINAVTTPDGGLVALSSAAAANDPWVGNTDGELLRLDGGGWSLITPVATWISWASHVIEAAPDGILWLHDCTVELLTEEAVVPIAESDSFCPELLEVDVSGVTWGAQHDGDVRVLVGDRWIRVTPLPAADLVVDLAAASSGRMWIATASWDGTATVRSFDGEAWLAHGRRVGQTYYRDFELPDAGWRSVGGTLASLPGGRMALATADGLYLYRSSWWTLVLTGWFDQVSASPDGSLWVAGTSGIYVWPAEDLTAFRPNRVRARLLRSD
jgi:hypothetical protein